MKIANYTSEAVHWRHHGVEGDIPAYDPEDKEKKNIVEFGEARGNHILATMSPRGLVKMEYSEDPGYVAQKIEQSIEMWTEFWERQITIINRHNDNMLEKGRPFSPPTPEVVRHAKMMGIEIQKPWTVKDSRDKSKSTELEIENKVLRDSIGSLQAQMAELMKMMNAKSEPEKKEISVTDVLEAEVETNRKKYKSLRAGTMKGWIKNNWELIKDMPEENRFEIESSYSDLYQTPYPTEKPE